jgi:fructokinase
MSQNSYKIVGIGELLWDMLPSGKQLGGAPCNFAFHAKQFGAQSIMVSSVGNDKLGDEIFENVVKMGLDATYIQRSDKYPTGKVDVALDQNKNPIYSINENVAWDNIKYPSELALLSGTTDAVCYGSLAQRREVSRDTIMRFVESTSPRCLRVFDINLRQNYYSYDVIVSSLKLANVLKLNEDELPILASLLNYPLDEAISLLIDNFSLKLVAYTKGGKGSSLYYGDQVSEMGVPKIDVVDPVGAGDAFTARMIMGLLRGETLIDFHKAATDMAAYVCSQRGATPLICN